MSDLSSRIKNLRISAGMTQEEFGKKFGIVKSTVSLYESGKSTPNDEIKKQICDYFKVSLDYLFGLSDASEKQIVLRDQEDSKISWCIGKEGYGIEELAEKLDIDERLLSDYVSGLLLMPYEILHSIANLCDVSTDYILGIVKKNREKDFDNVRPFEYNYQISGRIRKLCEDRDIDIESSFLQDLLSLSEKEVYYLIEYGFVPHMDTIIKLANYFNVSTDYLLCQIDEKTENALRSFRHLNADNQDIVVGDIKKYLKEQRHEESVAADAHLKKAIGK